MTKTIRPRIAIPGRVAESTSATRLPALVIAHRLVDAIFQAGGEPSVIYPHNEVDIEHRLEGVAGILIPGGHDVHPSFYGQEVQTESLYGLDPEQDKFDLSIAKYALDHNVPLFAICRGAQVVNVLRGGTLVQDLEHPHRGVLHHFQVDKYQDELGVGSQPFECSCFHHQAVDRLGDGLEVISTNDTGHAEAFKINGAGWAFGVQWHPEDNYLTDENQNGIFKKFVAEAAKFELARRGQAA